VLAKVMCCCTHRGLDRAPKAEVSVVEWLLDSDPALRWQVGRDVGRLPDEGPHGILVL
jgi:hypothetical protein